MSRLTVIKNSIRLCIALFLTTMFSAHAADLVTVNQVGSVVEWQIANTNFTVDKVELVITGPDQTAVLPSECTTSPLVCSFIFNFGNPAFDASELVAGAYNWQIEIIPFVDDLTCDSEVDVRAAQGGKQGLTGGVATAPEEDHLDCLRNAGLLPADDQELIASGSFNIDGDTALVVPSPTPPGTPDNIPPVAICMDITVEGSASSCSVAANVDDGSNDPDGTLASIVQDPAAPYGLGATNVTLTVEDDLGATASCSAIVTVTDSLVPDVLCPANSTLKPGQKNVIFTATATDTCSVPVVQATSYDCYRYDKKGNRKSDSCDVTLGVDGITVNRTSGVGSFIDWTVGATDSSGNNTNATCTIEVVNPGKNK